MIKSFFGRVRCCSIELCSVPVCLISLVSVSRISLLPYGMVGVGPPSCGNLLLVILFAGLFSHLYVTALADPMRSQITAIQLFNYLSDLFLHWLLAHIVVMMLGHICLVLYFGFWLVILLVLDVKIVLLWLLIVLSSRKIVRWVYVPFLWLWIESFMKNIALPVTDATDIQQLAKLKPAILTWIIFLLYVSLCFVAIIISGRCISPLMRRPHLWPVDHLTPAFALIQYHDTGV